MTTVPDYVPFPQMTGDPNSPVNRELLQLITQLHDKTLPLINIYLLDLVLPLPFISIETKLAIYNFLTHIPIISSIHLSFPVFILLTLFGPIGLLLVLGVFMFFVFQLAKLLVSFLPTGSFLFKEDEKTALQVMFPADTSKSAYATEQLYRLLHTLAAQKDGFWKRVLKYKKTYTLELVATKKEGIRYLMHVPLKEKDIVTRSLLSYLPGIKVQEIAKDNTDTLSDSETAREYIGTSELHLASHFALPLNKQKTLTEHDPMMYLTGSMTKLQKDEVILFQVVVSPVLSSIHTKAINEMNMLRKRMYKGEPLTPALQQNVLQKFFELPGMSLVLLVIKVFAFIIGGLLKVIQIIVMDMLLSSSRVPMVIMQQPKIQPQAILNPYEQELQTVVKDKIDQQLFETSIRLLVVSPEKEEVQRRLSGLVAAFGPLQSTYQSFTTKRNFLPGSFSVKQRMKVIHARLLSTPGLFHTNPLLSTSELSDLYHFPYTDTTHTEDLNKVYSKELAAAHSLKTEAEFDVVFGINTYGSTETSIGLNDEDRKEHILIIGRTNSGKSTIIGTMVTIDMQKGRGIALLDPHGDLSEELLHNVPEERIHDLMYYNPFDLKHPMCINILELSSGLSEDDLSLQKELVCEGIISIFRRVFNDEEKVNAHRIEYILRNTIHTAFTVPDATIFTVYKLLTNPHYQKEITSKLEDDNLRDFWKNEFGKAGDYQVVKMVGGVTAKVGRFLFSPIAKRILENPKSTISFDDLLNNGKILIANLSEGRLGEDTSHLLGTVILTKIHQAAMQRQKMPMKDRRPCYLFVDEFQNFASSSFTKMLSSGRKFGLRIVLAEQTTAQQDDRTLVNVIVANIGTFISFRLASPLDEELLLSLYSPYVKQGELMYLPKHHFYVKLGAAETPEPPFSGKTIPFVIEEDQEKVTRLIQASRKNYTITYEKQIEKKIVKKAKVTKRNGVVSSNSNRIVGRLLPEQVEVS